MNSWKRLSHLVERGAASLLEDTDDAETKVAHAIRTLERGLAGVKGYAAGAVAAERRLAREIRRQEVRVEQWRQLMVQALAAGHEHRARRLRRLLHEHTELLGGLQVHHDSACQASASARISIHAIAVRLVESRQIQLVAQNRKREQALQACEEVAAALHEVEQENAFG